MLYYKNITMIYKLNTKKELLKIILKSLVFLMFNMVST